MVFNYVADSTSPIVEGPATLDSEILRHCNLNVFDLIAIPERVQKRIRKPEVHYVINRLLPKVMVNAKDGLFAERSSRIWFSSRADLRSVPNGFSTITRAFLAQPDFPSCSTTSPNSTGGIAR